MNEMILQLFAEPELPELPKAPEVNYETEAFINTAPGEAEPVWVTLKNLIKNMSQTFNEVIVEGSYFGDVGWGSSQVTGAKLTLTLTGEVKPGDEACDYIMSDKVMFGFGAARQTHIKLVRDKKVIIWPVTLANITPAYGEANQANALTVTVHGCGKPSIGTIE